MNEIEVKKLKKISLLNYELNYEYKPQILTTNISKIFNDLKKISVNKNLVILVFEKK